MTKILRFIAICGLLFSVGAFAQSPSMYGWNFGNPTLPTVTPPVQPAPTAPVLTCPLRNSNPETVDLGPAHTGRWTQYNGSGKEVDIWFSGTYNVDLTLFVKNSGWFSATMSPASFNARANNAEAPLVDAFGVTRGKIIICADPSPWRTPKTDFVQKEIVGSGCNVLSIGYTLDGQLFEPELYSITLKPDQSEAVCFR